jgi:ribonuclease HI
VLKDALHRELKDRGAFDMSKELVSIYVDGAARGNPGPAGSGVVLKTKGAVLKTLFKYIGEATNNVAEYNALILGLQEALQMGYEDAEVCLDSELVAQQLKGEFRVKNENIKPLFQKAIMLINNFSSFKIVKIPREENKEADKLANKAINLSGLNKQIG